MGQQCDIVRDLLPLYTENMVSEASRDFVDSHLQQCEACCRNLGREEKPLKIPVDVEIGAFLRVKRDLRKRTAYPVLMAVFFALTLFFGICVCAAIPVNASYEEAVLKVEEKDGLIRVLADDSVSGIVSINNSFYFQKRRLDWFYTRQMRNYREEQEHWHYFQVEEGESLWYNGIPTGSEDICIWGDGSQLPDTGVKNRMDKTLHHIFLFSLVAAALLLISGCFLHRKCLGHVFLYTGMAFLLCAASCVFVTEGHLLEQEIRFSSIQFDPMLPKLFAVGIMTVLSWFSGFFVIKTVKIFTK